MINALQYGFMQRALIAGLLVAVTCSIIGVFLILRRLSLIGDGLAHLSFGGVALGILLGVYPPLAALILAVLGALGISALRKRVQGDIALGIIFSLGLSLGVVFISLSSKGFGMDLFSYLFGSILSVTEKDVLLMGLLSLIVISFTVLFYKELFYITFDEESAKAGGIPVGLINTLLLVLTAVTIVASMRVVGILLVSSFIIVPAAASMQISGSFKKTIIYSIIFSVIAVFMGLLASYYLNIATGGAIVLSSILLFFIVSLIS